MTCLMTSWVNVPPWKGGRPATRWKKVTPREYRSVRGSGAPPRGDLGCHVERGGERLPVLGHGHVALSALGEAEVGDARLAGRVDHQVGWLDVAVHDASAVSNGEPPGDLLEELEGAAGLERAVAAEDRVEPFAVDILHRDVVDALGLADGVHLHEVGVRQRGCVACFAVEPGDEVLARREAAGQGLDGDHAVERALACLEDCAHAAAPDQLENLEVAERAANERIALAGAGCRARHGQRCLAAGAHDRAACPSVHFELMLTLGTLGDVPGHRCSSRSRQPISPCRKHAGIDSGGLGDDRYPTG